MRTWRDPSPANHRRLEALVWKPGGLFEDYRRNSWEGAFAGFSLSRHQKFQAFGHRWTMDLSAAVWSKDAEVVLSLRPTSCVSKKEILRLERAGFYDDVRALVAMWGYRSLRNRGGGLWNSSPIASPRDIVAAQRTFETLDLGSVPHQPKAPVCSFSEFLRWGRRSRSRGWQLSHLEVRVPSSPRACDVRWNLRCDLFVGAAGSCSWFYAWPPKAFRRSDWRRVERTGFFEQATEELRKLGFVGTWRPGLFTDPDRLAAEFAKPTQNERTARRDFDALLRWRLPSGG